MGGNPNFAIQVVFGDHVYDVTILWLSSLGLKSLKFGPLYSTKYLHLACSGWTMLLDRLPLLLVFTSESVTRFPDAVLNRDL